MKGIRPDWLAALTGFLEREDGEKATIAVLLVAMAAWQFAPQWLWRSATHPASKSWFMELIPGAGCQDVTDFLAPAAEMSLARQMGSAELIDHGGDEVTIVEERSDRIVNVRYFRTMEACRSAGRDLDKYR